MRMTMHHGSRTSEGTRSDLRVFSRAVHELCRNSTGTEAAPHEMRSFRRCMSKFNAAAFKVRYGGLE